MSGLLAAMLVYLGPAVIGVCGAAVFAVLSDGVVTEAVVGIAVFTGFVFVATYWITLPLGLLEGTLYERSRSPDE